MAPDPLPPALTAAIDTPPIIVTATKRAVTLDNLPMAVSRFELGRDDAVDPHTGTSRVAQSSEGLAQNGLGPGRNRLFIRGVADSPFNGESQATVAIVLDEARLTYAAPDPDIRLIDVDRVEVLKGPQGSLYGTGALGGIYRIVTRRADSSQATLETSAGIGAQSRGSIGGSVSAIANLPLLRDRVGLRIVAYAAREPGWIDTGLRADSNLTRVTGGRFDLGIEPGGGWRLDLAGLGQVLNARDSSYVYQPGLRSRPAQLSEPHDNDLSHVALRAARTDGPVEFSFSTGATWHEVRNTLDATVGALNLGLSDPQRFDDDRQYRVWDTEARATGHLGSITWLVGTSYLGAWQHEHQVLEGVSGQQVVLNDEQRSANDAAVFTDLTVPLTNRVSLDAGGRLSHNAVTETRALPSGPVTLERARVAVTPSLAIAWKPSPRRLVYLRYGSAFRSGGIDVTPSGGLRELVGDELATVEVGWRERLPHGGRLELGAWYSRWENVQSDLLGANGLIETANVGKAAIAGIEGSLTQPLANASRLELGANFTSALLTHDALGLTLGDRRLPVVPEYVLRGSLEHDFRFAGGTTTLRAALRYVGPARLSFDPAIDRSMGNVLESEFGMTSEVGNWTFGAQVRNLIDASQDTFAYGNPFRLRSTHQFTPQAPLNARFSAAVHF